MQHIRKVMQPVIPGGPFVNEQFLKDVETGLKASPKCLPSKYFYDKEGDRLFQQIMRMDEYYLTDCEFQIFSSYREDLLGHFSRLCDRFHLIEFGAGDGLKTRLLLHFFIERKTNFEYNPIDISGNALEKLVSDLQEELPELDVEPINLEYFDALEDLGRKDSCRKVILFLGSNIGNFSMSEAQSFFNRLGNMLQSGDMLLTGFDLRKDPEIILAAYNDKAGITSRFNLNLLRRINWELDADFNLDGFYHYPVYDPVDGAARSYLISRKEQVVSIGAIPMTVKFAPAEPVFTEISQKYSIEKIHQFARLAGFSVKQDFSDRRKYFVNSLWEKD